MLLGAVPDLFRFSRPAAFSRQARVLRATGLRSSRGRIKWDGNQTRDPALTRVPFVSTRQTGRKPIETFPIRLARCPARAIGR